MTLASASCSEYVLNMLPCASGFVSSLGNDTWVLRNAGTLEADPSQAMLPDVQIKLGDDSLEPSQCNFGLVTYAETLNPEKTLFTVWYNDELTNSTRDDDTGIFTRKFLFQNYQACIDSRSSLKNVTSIGFSSNTANVSFCLQDFRLLPTQVPSAGEVHIYIVAVALQIPPFPPHPSPPHTHLLPSSFFVWGFS